MEVQHGVTAWSYSMELQYGVSACSTYRRKYRILARVRVVPVETVGSEVSLYVCDPVFLPSYNSQPTNETMEFRYG